jgi:predicted amidophosphoribosyltransferase
METGDQCLFFGEYFSGKGFSGGPTNQPIHNFKIKPSIILANPARRRYKEDAIREIAAGLRRAIVAESISQITFVPIPPSKLPGHPDYCDRMIRTLNVAFEGMASDVHPLLIQTSNAIADHESDERMSMGELLNIVKVDERQLIYPPRRMIVLFDDVLTSGKHFKACKQRITEKLPGWDIFGVFVARCVRPNPFDDGSA